MTNLSVEYMPTEVLTPYEGNAKIHTVEQVEQIKKSITEFGMNDPIAVWGADNLIVEGHGRLLACQQLGIETVPVIRLDSLSDEQRRAYTLAHNQLTMNTGFDLEFLSQELDNIELDMSNFGFDLDVSGDWFENRERNDDSRQEGNEEYNEFLDKFETKKTTDDCYTPDNIYNAVADWVSNEYKVNRSNFVRPFKPNGDYQSEKYPADCAVVDNPPFSILSEIIRWYSERNIKFFLFAPALTLFIAPDVDGLCYLVAGGTLTYENGAKVNTGFITNMDDKYMLRAVPELSETLKKLDKENSPAAQLPTYEYPDEVITATMLKRIVEHGVALNIKHGSGAYIRELDSQKEVGKGLYGGGFLLSRKATANKVRATEQAQKNKEEKEQAQVDKKVWALSESEQQIIDNLSKEE